MQELVLGQIDFAHAARAEFLLEPILPELAGLEGLGRQGVNMPGREHGDGGGDAELRGERQRSRGPFSGCRISVRIIGIAPTTSEIGAARCQDVGIRMP